MKLPRFKLTGQFVAQTVIFLSILTLSLSYILVTVYQKNLEKFYQSSTDIMESNLKKKGELYAQFISKVSAEAVMTQDLYTLQKYASETAKDNDVSSIKIIDAKENALVSLGEDVSGQINFTFPIITDKEKLGIEKKVGQLKVGINPQDIINIKSQNRTQLREQRNKALLIFLGVCILINLLIAGILIFGFKLVVLKPIKSVSTQLQEISMGQGDLTKRLNYHSKNELGELSGWFEKFVGNLQVIIRDIAGQSNQLEVNAKDLQGKVSSVTSKTNSMTEATRQVEESAMGASQQISEVSITLNQLSESVETINHSSNEISISLTEVSANCLKETQMAVEAHEKAKSAQSNVKNLENAAREIGDVLDVIKKIAAQTNLLSLNATIEAASAGEAGKGFAIVAGEIKELANQTGQATIEIEQKIKDIQSNTQSSVDSIEEIANVNKELNQISLHVASAIEEQSATMNQVNSNVSEVNAAASKVSENLKEASNNIARLKDNIVSIAKDIISNGEEMKTAEARILDLDNTVENLQNVVKQFKY